MKPRRPQTGTTAGASSPALHDRQLALPGFDQPNDHAAQIARLYALLAERDAQVSALRLELSNERAERERLAVLVADLARTRSEAPPPIIVSHLWREYDHAHRSQTWWRSVAHLMRPSIAVFGERDLWSLTKADWRDFVAEHRAHLAPNSRRLELKRWRAMIRWARGEGMIAQNQFHPFESLKLERRGARRRTEITHEHVAAILPDAGVFFTALLLVCVDSGLRRAEALSLEWSWIDFDRKVLRLPADATKGGTHWRDVPTSDRALEAIRSLPRAAASPLIFTNPHTGRRFSLTWASDTFRKLADEAGVPAAPGDGNAHLHDTRGSLAVRLLRQGATIRQIMEALGWQSIATADAYVARWSREDDEALRQIVQDAARERRPARRAETTQADIEHQANARELSRERKK